MIKEIDEKYGIIKYLGKSDELKEQINFILEDWPEVFRRQNACEIDRLDEVSGGSNSFGDMHQRIYYNNKELLYRVNTSSPNAIKFHFGLIKKICENADSKFLGISLESEE